MLLPDHGEELVAGDEFDLASLGKPPGILSESARCHRETTDGPLRRHHTVEFAHSRNADLSCFPLLALDHVPIVALGDDKVDATIRATTASFFNLETALPEKLADQQLKLPIRSSKGDCFRRDILFCFLIWWSPKAWMCDQDGSSQTRQGLPAICPLAAQPIVRFS